MNGIKLHIQRQSQIDLLFNTYLESHDLRVGETLRFNAVGINCASKPLLLVAALEPRRNLLLKLVTIMRFICSTHSRISLCTMKTPFLRKILPGLQLLVHFIRQFIALISSPAPIDAMSLLLILQKYDS